MCALLTVTLAVPEFCGVTFPHMFTAPCVVGYSMPERAPRPVESTCRRVLQKARLDSAAAKVGILLRDLFRRTFILKGVRAREHFLFPRTDAVVLCCFRPLRLRAGARLVDHTSAQLQIQHRSQSEHGD